MSNSPFNLVVIAMSLTSGLVDLAYDLVKVDKGKVSVVSVGKLTMTDSEGKNEHSYVVPAESKVTLNDKEAKLTDLKAGDAVSVTTGMEGEVTLVAAVRTKSPNDKSLDSHTLPPTAAIRIHSTTHR